MMRVMLKQVQHDELADGREYDRQHPQSARSIKIFVIPNLFRDLKHKGWHMMRGMLNRLQHDVLEKRAQE